MYDLPMPTPPGGSYDDDPMFCGTCKRGLHSRLAKGVLSYLHTAEVRGEPGPGHPAAPVPLSAMPDAIVDCDFCDAPNAVYLYRAGQRVDQHRVVVRETVGRSDYRDRHHAARVIGRKTEDGLTHRWGELWTACNECAVLVENRQLLDLVRRVTELMPAKMTRGKHLIQIRGKLIDRYTNVFETLTPGRTPIRSAEQAQD